MSAARDAEPRPLRFGTRGSALALAQTQLVIDCLHAVAPLQRTEVQIIRTEGDLDRLSPLTEIGGRGVFTNAIEREILAGRIDAAVHSAKDLPTALHPDAPLVAFPDRDDPRDVLISRHGTTLDALPGNPVIGTSSRRREALLRRLRPDAVVRPIRGNIDTRLRKAESSEFDAVVLAAAGLVRMGWTNRVSEYLDAAQFVPSPGQGAIAIQGKAGTPGADILALTDRPSVSGPVLIERAFLEAIGAGCTTPVGALATASGDGYRFVGMLADTSGQHTAIIEETLAIGEERRHVAEIAERLLADVGAAHERRSWRGVATAERGLSGATVVVTRPRPQAGQLLSALACLGAEAIALPTIRVEPTADNSELDAALQAAASGAFNWIAFTSANAVDAVERRLSSLGMSPRQLANIDVAVVGRATEAAATALGLHVTLVPESPTGDDLAASLLSRVSPGERVLYPHSAIGRKAIRVALRAAGVEVVAIDAYRTVPERHVDQVVVDRLRRGNIDAMTFSSPSSVHNLVALVGGDLAALSSIPAICAGPVTAHAVEEAGLLLGAVSPDPGATAMAETVAVHWSERTTATPAPLSGQMMHVAAATEGSVE